MREGAGEKAEEPPPEPREEEEEGKAELVGVWEVRRVSAGKKEGRGEPAPPREEPGGWKDRLEPMHKNHVRRGRRTPSSGSISVRELLGGAAPSFLMKKRDKEPRNDGQRPQAGAHLSVSIPSPRLDVWASP